MSKKDGKSFNKKKLAATIVLASAVVATGYDVNRLSADPTGTKDCEPISISTTDALPTVNDVKVEISPLSLGDRLQWLQKGGTINDASCLNRTSVYGIVQINTVEDIKNAILFAKENNLKISMAGVRHSMGGQAFYRNNLILDMRNFNMMTLDEENKVITVQSGAIWHDIQNYLIVPLHQPAFQKL